ncbi:hypothetical protein KHC17_10405 [Agrobacterium salinitolerans]|uniref:hypothetical protein n=1 Tax=Agrobacterium salinitolerans TaxID=1183413 RepID=UPI001C2379AB|nr:hypothetical protein [Agrobacterium salinitolerans]QXC50939.1 hypothetical protein KHC17_10405 [Agrobacterium salinitolerans]
MTHVERGEGNETSEPIFYDSLTDTKYRDRLKTHNEELYRYYLNQEEWAHNGHTGYAKWLFASLLAVHGGAIYALNALRTSVPAAKSDFLIYAAAQNLSAIFLTLVAGLFAWVNLQLAELYYKDMANPKMLYRHDAYPKPSDWIDRTLYASAICGTIAGLLFATSSVTVIMGLFHVKPSPVAW